MRLIFFLTRRVFLRSRSAHWLDYLLLPTVVQVEQVSRWRDDLFFLLSVSPWLGFFHGALLQSTRKSCELDSAHLLFADACMADKSAQHSASSQEGSKVRARIELLQKGYKGGTATGHARGLRGAEPHSAGEGRQGAAIGVMMTSSTSEELQRLFRWHACSCVHCK